MDTHQHLRILNELGLVVGSRQAEAIDYQQAEHCYIHHTRMPIAVAGYSLVSPIFTRGRFPQTSFIDLIQKRSAMDQHEKMAFAKVCGIRVTPPFWNNPAPFAAQLFDVIEKYELDPFFEIDTSGHVYDSGDHYRVRPRGYSSLTQDQPDKDAMLAKWRADYRKLSTVKQLMVATIMQLYRQGEDKIWMVRVPKKWHAAEGIAILYDNQALDDWARLYTLYPAW